MAKKPKSENQYALEQRYIKANYKWVNLQFSRKNPEDMLLYEHIRAQGESRAAYVKRLVAEDMKRRRESGNG